MAIDDNTLYGLTGAQVKELPGKIEAIKGLARELTTDDYNWPASNPDGVALWQLEPGLYSVGDNISVYLAAGGGYKRTMKAVYLIGAGGTGTDIVWAVKVANESLTKNVTNLIMMRADGSSASEQRLLNASAIANNLTSTASNEVLSAGQGKVLNDKIGGDLSNLTTTDKTSLINAINEVAAGGSGGGITELTSADYNWPTANPDGIALWLLPVGSYNNTSSLKVYTSSSSSNTYPITFQVMNAGVDNNREIVGVLFEYFGSYNIAATYKDNGATLIERYFLQSSAITQTTGTSTTSVMSQSAVTSMIFADPATQYKIKIGAGAASAEGDESVEIGHDSAALAATSVALGYTAYARGIGAIAIGREAQTTSGLRGTIALGSYSSATNVGEMNIGSSNINHGYNNSNYRLLTGLYDPQSDHDAATKGYVDTAVGAKQDALTAGDNITIAEESGALVISATGGSSIDTFTTNEWNALWA